MKKTTLFYSRLSAFLLAAPITLSFAQQSPDAGRTLQELAPTLKTPQSDQDITIQVPKTLSPATINDKAEIFIQTIEFTGNTVFSDAQLQNVLRDTLGKPFNLSGLPQLSTQISNFYRQAGYSFAQATAATSPTDKGKLHIEIIEGNYGKVRAIGEPKWNAAAQGFLSPLKPGEVIKNDSLERATLLLTDQPGIKTVSTIRPGQQFGTGDLNVKISRSRLFSGDFSVDNYGNRYTGAYRANVNLQANSPFFFGDQIAFRGLITDERLWLGYLLYSLPLGKNGLRGQVAYAQTRYELGKEFSILDAQGTAKITTLRLSYPFLRRSQANITLAASYQFKDLQDTQAATNTQNDKSSNTLPLTVQFDVRDQWGGGGVTFGALGWTIGNLRLDQNLTTIDQQTARTNGHFQKLNFDMARLQFLPKRFAIYGRLTGQWTNKNLDSSEDFSLGGINGIRAYPVGEAYGDRGALVQMELRYSAGHFSPYAFYDAGRVTTDVNPWTTNNNHRHIAGAGLGVRFYKNAWKADATIAWRTAGGKPQSDTVDRVPTVLFTASYKF